MSKVLEAFENVMQICSNLKLDYLTWHDLMDSLETIHEHLTPPTEEELCKALSEYYGFEVMYKDLDFFPKYRLSYLSCVVVMVDGCIDFADPLPLYLITLISRFYEGAI